MKREDYYLVLRVAAVVMALLLWYLSVFFSNKGFNFQVADMQWAAWILAASVTVIELVWTKQGFKPSPTLFVFGLAAYAYGIGTNILGIMEAQGTSNSQNPISIVFPFVLGFFLEVIPEPLAIWGVIGVSDEGDFLGTLFGFRGSKPEFQIPTPPRSPLEVAQPMQRSAIPQAIGGKPTRKVDLPPFLAKAGENKTPDHHNKML